MASKRLNLQTLTEGVCWQVAGSGVGVSGTGSSTQDGADGAGGSSGVKFEYSVKEKCWILYTVLHFKEN